MADSLGKRDSLETKQAAENFVLSPDIYIAAAVMVVNRLFQGKGDLQRIWDAIIMKSNVCPILTEKLKLIRSGTFLGQKLLKDKFKNYPEHIPVGKKQMFKLWFNLVRKNEVLTTAQFADCLPESLSRAELWDEVVDSNGN